MRGIISAIVDAVRSGGQVVRGASTITQQVMKNLNVSSSSSVFVNGKLEVQEPFVLTSDSGKDSPLTSEPFTVTFVIVVFV